MKPDDVRTRLDEFEALCRRRRLPLTVQRRDILKALLERNDHPTADQLYESLADRIPGLSRTTVYRVLGLLVEMGVVRRLHHSGTAVRFDGRVGRHHHLICKHCDKIIDVCDAALDELPLPQPGNEGFEIDDFSIHFTGTCAECRGKNAEKGTPTTDN
jgi:Fur family transcriptional regulator, peroxide stress response regulator